MRRVSLLVLAVGAAALLASPVLAQPRGGRGFMGGMQPWRLVTQKSVQTELKMSEEQVKKADALGQELAGKQRELFESLQDLDQAERGKKMQEFNQTNDKAVAAILKPEQTKRLKEIAHQVAGVQAFNNPEVVSALKLTDAQKEKLNQIRQDMREEMRDIFQGGGDQAENMKKIRELNKKAAEKAVSELTPEQKTKWKEMTGKPFTGEITFQGRRRGA
jgi:hypothetical protein